MPPKEHLQVQRLKTWVAHMDHRPTGKKSQSATWEPQDKGKEKEELELQRPPLVVVLEWAWMVHEEINPGQSCPFDIREMVAELGDVEEEE